MTKKSKLTLALASMLGITAGATAVSGFAWFTTTKSATVSVANIGVYSKSSALAIAWKSGTRCTGVADEGTLSVSGDAATTPIAQTFTATASQTEFTLDKHPSALPTLTIKHGDADPVAGTATAFNKDTKVVTISDSVSAGDIVTFTYLPYETMTDVSSVDGKTFYKPTWTATGEGKYATALPTTDTGYVKFTMTLSATGASALVVYANSGVAITPAKAGDPADVAAAAITRVAIIDEDADGDPTMFVTQNSVSSGNVGINSTWAAPGAKNWDADDDETMDGWNLKATGGTALPTISNLVQANAIADKSAQDSTWAASNKAYTDGYITTIPAGGSRDISVAIWLEGTNETDANGAFTGKPENGMIGVNLPLIAI